jgi:hypothetical protein
VRNELRQMGSIAPCSIFFRENSLLVEVGGSRVIVFGAVMMNECNMSASIGGKSIKSS